MPFLLPQGFNLFPGQGQGPQGYPLVKPHATAYFGSFAHHHPGTMVDEETFADMGPGMNIDTGEAVGVFRHDTRHQGNPLPQELVGQTIDRDGEKARITEDDFIITLGSRVPFVSGTHILGNTARSFGQFTQEMDGLFPAAVFAVAAILVIAQTFMPDAQGDLFGQGLKKATASWPK